MRKFYDTVEQAYGNPANYPEAIAAGKIEGHHHQTEEVAWGYLGNAKRMETLGRLMEEAKAAAQTADQRQRVTLFEMGTWDYMTAGRKRYLEHAKARYGSNGAGLRVPLSSKGSLRGDPATVDASEALGLTCWRSRIAEPTRRKVAARLVHDEKYLYVQLEEQCDSTRLDSTDDIVSGDYWQVLFASQRGVRIHNLLLNAAGKRLLDGSPCNAATSIKKTPEACVVSIALPLAKTGVASGEHFYLNVVRRARLSDDQPMWSPSFGEFEAPDALRELTLDSANTIPARVPIGAEFQTLDGEGLVARWKLDEGQGVTVHSTVGGLNGKLTNAASWAKEEARSVVRLQDNRRQYVVLGNAKALDLTGPLTLLVWVSMNRPRCGTRRYWARGTNSPAPTGCTPVPAAPCGSSWTRPTARGTSTIPPTDV